MPILSPILPEKVQEVLSVANRAKAKRSIQDILDSALPVEDIINTIAEVSLDSGNQSTRLRAAELGAKLHGMLRSEETAKVPQVTIIIKGRDESEINSILLPRV
jgi:hypothetical protein